MKRNERKKMYLRKIPVFAWKGLAARAWLKQRDAVLKQQFQRQRAHHICIAVMQKFIVEWMKSTNEMETVRKKYALRSPY